MSVRVQLRFADLLAFSIYHTMRSPLVIVTYGIMFVLIMAAVWFSQGKDVGLLEHVLVVGVIGILVLAGMMLCIWLILILSTISKRNKTVKVEQTITLGESAFTLETIYGRSEMKWPIVQKLARTGRYIYVYISAQSAVVVPRRAFQVAGEWDSFYEYCQKQVSNSKAVASKI